MTFEYRLVAIIEHLEQIIEDASDSGDRGVEQKSREALGPLVSALGLARETYGRQIA